MDQKFDGAKSEDATAGAKLKRTYPQAANTRWMREDNISWCLSTNETNYFELS
jgi:hypothetical protein